MLSNMTTVRYVLQQSELINKAIDRAGRDKMLEILEIDRFQFSKYRKGTHELKYWRVLALQNILNVLSEENIDDIESDFLRVLRSWQEKTTISHKEDIFDILDEIKVQIESLESHEKSSFSQIDVLEQKPEKNLIWVKRSLRVENNTKFVRGKSRIRKDIEKYVISFYKYKKLDKEGRNYEIQIPYTNDQDLEE